MANTDSVGIYKPCPAQLSLLQTNLASVMAQYDNAKSNELVNRCKKLTPISELVCPRWLLGVFLYNSFSLDALSLL